MTTTMEIEQSPEQVAALEAHKAEFQADFERRKAEALVEWDKKHGGKKLSKERWRALNSTSESQSDNGLEPGEILSQSGSQAMPIRSADSSQANTPASSSLWESFQPRTEPIKKPPSKDVPERPDDFVGFGNVSASQETSKPQSQLPKLDTKTTENGKTQQATANSSSKTPTSAKPTTTTPSSAKPGTQKPESEIKKSSSRANEINIASSSSKRPPTTSVYADERRKGMANFKIQKRTSAASPQSPSRADEGESSGDSDSRPPKWYKDLSNTNTRDKNQANASSLLVSLRGQIKSCKEANKTDKMQEAKRFMEIRNKLHAVVFLEVDGQVLKNNLMLHNESGLPQLFDTQYAGGVDWPYDIRADAEELYNKWARKDFQTDMLRGIILKGTRDALGNPYQSDRLDDKFRQLSYKVFGNNNLLNGQWWPYQICTLRDGAHGASQGGIAGRKGKGAHSCIISGGLAQDGKPYPDEDHGDWVLYCGTDNEPSKAERRENRTYMPSKNTQLMIDSFNNKEAVRFIRSHKLGSDSDWKPQEGFRYDGLYDVVSYKRLDGAYEPRQRHQFKLVRQPSQDPIRGGKGAQSRPTPQEIEELHKHKRFSKDRD